MATLPPRRKMTLSRLVSFFFNEASIVMKPIFLLANIVTSCIFTPVRHHGSFSKVCPGVFCTSRFFLSASNQFLNAGKFSRLFSSRLWPSATLTGMAGVQADSRNVDGIFAG